MSYINKVNTGEGTHLIEPTLFAIAGGTASAYTAAISNFELVEGVVVNIKFTTTNSANATLNINNTGARTIKYKGSNIDANALIANRIYSFVCTNTNNTYYWDLISSLHTDVVLPHKLTFGAGGAYVYDGSADVTVPVYTGGII